MIDASTTLFDKSSKAAYGDKSNVNDKYQSKGLQGFAGYMTGATEKPSSKINDEAKEENRSRHNEQEESSNDGSPVSAGVVDEKPDQSREKVANILKQRANVLDKMSNNQDALAQKQVAAVEKLMSLDQVSDDLIGKLIEKLTLDKTKSELSFQNRLMMEKSLATLDASDTVMGRLSADSADKNLLLNALNAGDRINSTNPTQSMKMGVPINSPEWGAEFGKRIQMLMKNNIQQAELRMDPPEMGRIQVRINMNQDQMNITFTALNANVREALEANMTRLRDMLSETGIQLGETNVGGDFQQEAQASADGSGFSNETRGWGGEELSDDEHDSSASVIHYEIDGVIDYFA